MALDKQELNKSIKLVMNQLMQSNDVGIDEFADRLSDAIDKYVKAAKITYTSGLTAGNVAVTGAFNGKLE